MNQGTQEGSTSQRSQSSQRSHHNIVNNELASLNLVGTKFSTYVPIYVPTGNIISILDSGAQLREGGNEPFQQLLESRRRNGGGPQQDLDSQETEE